MTTNNIHERRDTILGYRIILTGEARSLEYFTTCTQAGWYVSVLVDQADELPILKTKKVCDNAKNTSMGDTKKNIERFIKKTVQKYFYVTDDLIAEQISLKFYDYIFPTQH